MSLIKSLRALLPASNCFLDKEELQSLCTLGNSTTKSISEDLLGAEITIVQSSVSSKLPDVLLNESTRMNLDLFLKWFSKYKAAFPTTYLQLSRGLTVGVSTATCEARFSSMLRIFTSYRSRCMTHDRKCQLALLGFEKNETATVTNEDSISEFIDQNSKTECLKYSLKLTLSVPHAYYSSIREAM